MSVGYRLLVQVLDGPQDGRGERVYPGDSVELAAFPSSADPSIPPQSCTIHRDGERMLLSPLPGAHLRLGPGEPWSEVERLQGEQPVEEGQLIYLGPIKRGLTIRLDVFRRSPVPAGPVRTKGFRVGAGLGFLALALICAWLVASASY